MARKSEENRVFFKKKETVNNMIRKKTKINPLDSVIWKPLKILDLFGGRIIRLDAEVGFTF